jgi:archaellum component FlaC
MHSVQKLTLSLLVLFLVIISPAAATAASFEFTVTAKTAFDKMKASADHATAAKLASQYAQLQTVQKQDIDWDAKINRLHYQNVEAELSARKRIKEIDAAKLQKLQDDVIRTKEKYEPLFDFYETLKQQLSITRSFKDKQLSSMLSPQVETTKAAVQLAKMDIRSKEAALKAAKTAAAKTMKKIRDILSDVDPLEVKIKAAKSSVSSIKKQFKTETSILNQVVRKGDSTATLSSFTRLLSFMKQVNDQKQKMYAYEQQIKAVIAKADAQMAI